MKKQYEFPSAWIFSPLRDFTIFIVLGLLVLFISAISHNNGFKIESYLLWYIFSEYLLSSGHVFGSFYPTLVAVRRKLITKRKIIFIVIFTFLLSFTLFNLLNSFFTIFLATSLLVHYIRQMVGWIHITQKRAAMPYRISDDIMLYSMATLPFCWYLADPLSDNKTLYAPGDLNFFKLPAWTADYFEALLLLISIAYILDQLLNFWKNRKVNIAKYTVIISAFICFYLPYVVFPRHVLFWAPNAVVHAFSYLAFTYDFSKKNEAELKYPVFLKNISFYFIFILIFGFLWSEVFTQGKTVPKYVSSLLLPAAWAITLLHFLADAFLWKRKYYRGDANS